MASRARQAPLLIAPDSFKGTLPAARVAAAIARGAATGGRATELCPVADGGEGTLEVLVGALGGRVHSAPAQDPLGRPVRGRYALLGDGATGVVEVASASGLALLGSDERDPLAASSAGTGELILATLAAGARSVLVAAGGSASTDGGRGAIAALRAGGGLGGARLTVLCDVRTPFEQAAARFGPQKGAGPAAVRTLARRLNRLARSWPRDPRGLSGTGAAGGLAGGLWAATGARLAPGASYVLDALGFDQRLRRARAVVVGEGRLDRGTLEGKAPAEVAVRARQAGVPAHAVVASNALDRFDARLLDLGLILEAGDERELERAGRALAARV